MSNLNRGRRDHRDSVPHLQVPRRSSGSHRPPGVGIGRLASPSVSSPGLATSTTATSQMGTEQLNTDDGPVLSSTRPIAARTRSFGGTTHASRRRSKITSGEALDLATGGASLRRPQSSKHSSSGAAILPSSSSFRQTRSFLLPVTTSSGLSGTGSVGGGGGAGGTHSGSATGPTNKSIMAPLPKPKRTTKTSQKLVVLPSAPQTKPLLDEEPETSDEEALPRVAITRSRLPHPLPPRVPTKGRIERAHMERAARGTEEVGSEEEGKGRAVEEPRPMKRVREYKSAAERMTKEERKKAGLKRITAYCVAEGLRMKSLAGFLKREHNVQPRIFDEALYAMYHLPLLPGYGPQINVRSGAAPSILKESSPLNRQKDLLGALEETEEDGYHDPYFQSQQHGSNLEMHHSERPIHSLSDTQLITTDATDGPGDLGSTLPGLVRPASVEEVRGADGYVTSDSFAPVDPSSYESTAHLEAEMLKNQSSSRFDQSASTFQPEYNPYPSSSEASSPKTLRELSGPFHSELGGGGNVTQVILPTSESFVEAAAASRGQLDDHLEGDRSIAASDETSLHNPTVDTSLSSSALDSGLETDDPGAFTDPGVYGPWPRNPKSGLSSSNEERGSRLNMAATTSTGTQTDTDGATTEADGEDSGQLHRDRPVTESTLTETGSVTAGQATSDLLRPLQKDGSGSGSDVTATAVLAKSDSQSPESTQVHTSNNVTAVNSSSSGDNSQTADKHGGVLSAYETQMAYDREREDAEYQFEQERERARQLEYERALERERERERERELDNVAEVVFFEYGVVVFFGLDERGERDILDDLEQAGAYRRLMKEDDWEIEECHFAHDPQIAYPRIYNDFFTLKSRSHLLKLAIAHGLAQSTLLARYEAVTAETLTSPMALSIPRQMAESGSLQLRRHDALKLTGRLFKLRRDVNLVSNVLDIPELFWSESSLKELYDAVRDYMEIDPRVDNLNERLGVASDFLDAIHDHLNNNAMDRITRIIIWLIAVAIVVELGEILARLVVHATLGKQSSTASSSSSLISGISDKLSSSSSASTLQTASRTTSTVIGSGAQVVAQQLQQQQQLSRAEALEALERIMQSSSS